MLNHTVLVPGYAAFVAYLNKRACELGLHYWSIRAYDHGVTTDGEGPSIIINGIKMLESGGKVASSAGFGFDERSWEELSSEVINARLQAMIDGIDSIIKDSNLVEADNPSCDDCTLISWGEVDSRHLAGQAD
jgi:hypothetical protein